MANLTRANRELYRRGPDESFQTLQELHDHCQQERQYSADLWQLPQTLLPMVNNGELMVTLEKGESVGLNDWSFSQMCRLSGISKETINRFNPDTATLAFRDTLPQADKPVQLLTTGKTVRSVHGVSYTRLPIPSHLGRRVRLKGLDSTAGQCSCRLASPTGQSLAVASPPGVELHVSILSQRLGY